MTRGKIFSYQELLATSTSENGEPIVDLQEVTPSVVCSYEKFDMEPYTGDRIFVRSTVASLLAAAARQLTATNPSWKLRVVYGYRHPAVQKLYFERQRKQISIERPELSNSELDEATHSFVAFPKVAGHPTGGAIDLTITTPEGNLDMGTSIADFTDPNLIHTFSDRVTETHRLNRMPLHDLLVTQGFAPFYGEWWHFSYGDREWAATYGQPSARYEPLEFSTK